MAPHLHCKPSATEITCVRIASSGDTAEVPDASWRRAIEDILSGAVTPLIHYQPIIDLHRGAVAGYEALARFAGPPQASPDRWLREAERLGLSRTLEARLLTTALDRLPALPANTFLTVNVSPDLLAADDWERALGHYQRLDRLVVEVTEHSAISDYDEIRTAIANARGRGALFAVDDAGSGYASLQHVMQLRPDFVKLDREFIDGCDKDPARAAMIEAVGSVANRLDAWVIAEGVETNGELNCLLRLGVPLAQGWLFGAARMEWTQAPAAAVAAIAVFRRRDADSMTIAGLVDSWPSVETSSSATPSAEPTDRPVEAAALTLVLDEDQRPLYWVGPALRDGQERVLVVKLHTPLRALARRAMTRGDAARFLPAVCTDESGRYLGVVRIERLVDRLAAG